MDEDGSSGLFGNVPQMAYIATWIQQMRGMHPTHRDLYGKSALSRADSGARI